MTDSILRSYQAYTFTSIVPFAVVTTFTDLLLSGETDGFAIDATDVSASPSYTGAAYAGYVSVKDTGTPANNLSNVALDGRTSNLVQSGTSAKIVNWGSSPYVRWTPHNIQTFSQAFDDTSWVKTAITLTADDAVSPSGVTDADKVVETNTVTSITTGTGMTAVTGAIYTWSLYVKPSNITWFRLTAQDGASNFCGQYFDVVNLTVGTSVNSGITGLNPTITSAGNGWVRLQVSGITTGSSALILFRSAIADNSATRVTSGTYWVWGGQINRGPIVSPYLATTTSARIGIPQGYDIARTTYGILVEPASTNLLTRSEDMSVTWENGGLLNTITINNTTSPDGATTADKVVPTSGTNHDYYMRRTAIGGTTGLFTVSGYFKTTGGTIIWLDLLGANSTFTKLARQSFNLNTGATGTALGTTWSVSSSSITAVGNGWYRCSVTIDATTDPVDSMQFGMSNNDDFATSTADGNGTDGIWAWGLQLEMMPIPTSYIPTISATASRAADIPSAVDSTFPGSDANITVYLDYKPLVVSSGTRYGWAYWKDASNFYSLAGITADPKMGNTNAGSPEFAVDLGTLVAGTRTQITVAGKANDFDGSQDGAAPTAQGTATLTTGYTTLYLGTFGSTGSELNGYIYRMVEVPYQRETVNGDLETWKYS